MTINRPSRELAIKAANLLFEHQILDYDWARKKIATGNIKKSALPDLSEIEDEVRQLQELFGQDNAIITAHQRAAIKLMHSFKDFSPRLVGPLSRNLTANHATAFIHLFSESAKYVLIRLLDLGIDYQSTETMIYDAQRTKKARPAFAVEQDGVGFLLIALNMHEVHHPPIDPVTNKPGYGLRIEDLDKIDLYNPQTDKTANTKSRIHINT